MLSGKDADGFSAIALAIFTRRSVRRRSPNSAVPNVSTAHFSGCSSPAMSICLTPFVYIVSPSSLPEFVLTCQQTRQVSLCRHDQTFVSADFSHFGIIAHQRTLSPEALLIGKTQ